MGTYQPTFSGTCLLGECDNLIRSVHFLDAIETKNSATNSVANFPMLSSAISINTFYQNLSLKFKENFEFIIKPQCTWSMNLFYSLFSGIYKLVNKHSDLGFIMLF